MKKTVTSLLSIAMTLLAGQANAWDTINDVKITAIELTCMPDNVPFIADRAGRLRGWNLPWMDSQRRHTERMDTSKAAA